MTKSYYVYLHRRVDNNEVFYVGCATKRAYHGGYECGHKAQYSRAYDFQQRKPEWFATREAAGGLVVEFVQEFTDRTEAFALEVGLIAKYGRADRGKGILVNHTDGGDGMPGFKDRPESRQMKSITKIGSLNPMYGKTGAKHPMARPVVHVLTGIFYDTVQEAADTFGYKMKTLHNLLSNHRLNRTPLRFA